jgi:preprotein translocase subunit SecF
MQIVKNKKIFFIISGIIVTLSLATVAFFGLRLGIDFTGGTLVEFSCSSCEKDTIDDKISKLNIGNHSLRESGDGNNGTHSFTLRTKPLSNSQRTEILASLKEQEISVGSFSEVGPTIGDELRHKAVWAIVLVMIAIVLFVAFTFRPPVVKREETPEGVVRITRDNHGVSSWIYGIVAIIALAHDVIVPTGVFALLGQFSGAEVGVLFVMALLAILGYSVNDTIVVFDRVREHLKDNADNKVDEEFGDTVGKALSETITRSINTSLTTLITLVALYIFGPAVTQKFALTLIAGVIAGTYSSIFLASPLLVAIKKWKG